MVYEARPGQTFMLGASTWRIEEITRDRVLVSPAPGVPGAVPFWKGEGVGRPYELGEAIGARRASSVAPGREGARAAARRLSPRRAGGAGTSSRTCASRNAATGAVPSDRTVVVERFRDEIGDWRVCILTPFGGARARAVGAGARQRGCASRSGWRCSRSGRTTASPSTSPRPTRRRRLADLLIDAGRGRGARRPGGRADRALRLALSRERGPGAADPAPPAGHADAALAAAPEGAVAPAGRAPLSGLPDRPRDLPGVPAGRLRPAGAARAAARAADAGARRRRGGDADRIAVRRVAALRLHRHLHVRGRHAAGRAPRAGAVARPRAAARAARPGGAAGPARPRRASTRSSAQLRGDAADARRAARPAAAARRSARRRVRRASWPSRCSTERRAVLVRVGGEERLIAAEDAGRYRDALGAMPPSGLPDAFLEAGRAPLRDAACCASRKGRGPFTTARGGERFGRDVEPRARASSSARSGSSAASCARAAPSASGATRTCCGACGARRSRRCAARSSPSSRRRSRASCRRGTASTAARRCARRWSRCRRLPCRWRSGSPRSCRGACPGYRPEHLDALCASGEVVWVGAGLDRVALYFREDAAAARPRPPAAPRPRARRTTRSARALGRAARCSGSTCSPTTGARGGGRLPALWDLVWAGEVTNDAWTPLRAGAAVRRPAAGAPAAPLLAPPRDAVTATQGRWSLTDAALRRRGRTGARSPSSCSSGRASSRATACAPRGSPAATARSTPSCARSRRSASAAAATSSRGSAARSSRSAARSSGCASCAPRDATSRSALVLAAADPAQPYGAALPWPKRAGARAARVAGAYVVLLGGEAALFVERGGRSLVPLREPDEAWLRPALAALVEHVRARRREAPRGRALRRRAGRRDRGDAAARRGRLPRGPAPRRPRHQAGRRAGAGGPGGSLRDTAPSFPTCPKATRCTARRSACRCSWASRIEVEAAASTRPVARRRGAARRAGSRRRGARQEPPLPLRGRRRPAQPPADERELACRSRAVPRCAGCPGSCSAAMSTGRSPQRRQSSSCTDARRAASGRTSSPGRPTLPGC